MSQARGRAALPVSPPNVALVSRPVIVPLFQGTWLTSEVAEFAMSNMVTSLVVKWTIVEPARIADRRGKG